jgi:hypothetical protein
MCPRNFVCAQMEKGGGFHKKRFWKHYSIFQAIWTLSYDTALCFVSSFFLNILFHAGARFICA